VRASDVVLATGTLDVGPDEVTVGPESAAIVRTG
jgi:hypothetical protein